MHKEIVRTAYVQPIQAYSKMFKHRPHRFSGHFGIISQKVGMDAAKYGVDFGLMVGNALILQTEKVRQNMGVCGKKAICQTLFKNKIVTGRNRCTNCGGEEFKKKPFVKRIPMDDKNFFGRLLFGEIT